jgi:hypothetical protein
MLSDSGGNLQKFYQKCGQLAKKDIAERHRILEQYGIRTAEQDAREVQ